MVSCPGDVSRGGDRLLLILLCPEEGGSVRKRSEYLLSDAREFPLRVTVTKSDNRGSLSDEILVDIE